MPLKAFQGLFIEYHEWYQGALSDWKEFLIALKNELQIDH